MATSWEEEKVFVDGELVEPQLNDPEFATSKSLKEEEEEGKKKEEEKKKKKKNGADNLKSSLIISGVVIAVIGAIFAVAKKIKEA